MWWSADKHFRLQVIAPELAAQAESIARKQDLYTTMAANQRPLQRRVLELFFQDPDKLREEIDSMTST